MKIILTQYVEKLGDVGDVVEVKDGYANNYLLPQGVALLATKGNMNQMELVRKAAQKVEAKNIEEAKKLAGSLEGLEIVFTVKTGEEGKLYGSVTNKDIAEKILADKNIEIDRKKIDMEEHIKELGEYTVDLKLYKEVKVHLKVRIEPDEESKQLIEAHRAEKESQESGAGAEVEAEVETEEAKEDTAGEKEIKNNDKEKIKDKTKNKEADINTEKASGTEKKTRI